MPWARANAARNWAELHTRSNCNVMLSMGAGVSSVHALVLFGRELYQAARLRILFLFHLKGFELLAKAEQRFGH